MKREIEERVHDLVARCLCARISFEFSHSANFLEIFANI